MRKVSKQGVRSRGRVTHKPSEESKMISDGIRSSPETDSILPSITGRPKLVFRPDLKGNERSKLKLALRKNKEVRELSIRAVSG